jgi:hypothetical protein
MERKVALRNQRFCKLLRIRRTQFCQLELVRGDFTALATGVLQGMAQGIDSPLRGFVTASLSGFSVPLIPNTHDRGLMLPLEDETVLRLA